MVRAVDMSAATADQRDAIVALLDSAGHAAAEVPLSDHLLVDLTHPEQATATALLLTGAQTDAAPLRGVAIVQPGNGVWSLEVVVHPTLDSDTDVLAELVRAASTVVADRGGGRVNWWVLHRSGATATAAAVAARTGFTLGRELHQMRRAFPLEQTTDLTVRPFVVGRDEEVWLHVNNRAFATHAEQGGWTASTLAAREAEPWFDPAGFLLHERDGTLAGFCWTKVHEFTDPPMGEIYAIAVDPTFHGLGLGRALTVAGLNHLAGAGLSTAMLHVDAVNTAAVALYDKLDFTIHHTDRAYLAEITPGASRR